MKKVRVFELAREFGMKGPELAKLLREIGFEKVKTHMTALDDADLMMVEARLSAQGLRRKAAGGKQDFIALGAICGLIGALGAAVWRILDIV